MRKTCSRCGAEHPVSFFIKDRTTKDGLRPQCKDCSRRACRVSYRLHEAEHRALKQRWKDANRERHHTINAAWAKANPEKCRKRSADYMARLRQATPAWVDWELMDFVCSECPPGWHIDHIHPLAGKNFCGLNVPWNIQYLPPDEHFRKGTKLPADAGGHSDL